MENYYELSLSELMQTDGGGWKFSPPSPTPPTPIPTQPPTPTPVTSASYTPSSC